MQTPNFAMNTSDIDVTAPPAEKRCTAHLFEPDKRYYLGRETLPPGPPLRISDNPLSWPPAVLFDAVYAGAVLEHFGTETLKDEVARTWNNIFYPGGVVTAVHADHKATLDKRAASAAKTQKDNQNRTARREARSGPSGPDTFDMLMTLPYIMVPPNELQAMLREAEEKAEAMEQRRVHEKVDTWMKQITPQ